MTTSSVRDLSTFVICSLAIAVSAAAALLATLPRPTIYSRPVFVSNHSTSHEVGGQKSIDHVRWGAHSQP